ncbi:glycosyl transferase family group 2-domain-containing protein [Infundibulicybe gibba]|nr:glycosyl transferase family group 2-domain-containing protein [Infundibulicybe gibba]
MDYDRNDALLHWLFRQTQGDAWFRPNEEHISSGSHSASMSLQNSPFETAVAALNPVVAVKVRSASVHAALAEVAADEKSIYVDANTRIQILETMLQLPQAEKEQCAAFIRDERVLVVWSDDRLIKLLWRSRPAPSTAASVVDSNNGESGVQALSPQGSGVGLGGSVGASSSVGAAAEELDEKRKGKGKVEVDLEDSNPERDARRVKLYAPVYNGIAAGLALFFIGNGINVILQEFMLDGQFIRFALFAVVPMLYCVSMFFALQIVQNITMAIGPIAHYHKNSMYYSAIKPRANKEVDNALPHITIQMPVYKEGLTSVLAPSIESLKKAMQTYARQGGSSTIFINDDGLRLLPAPDRDERLSYYANHNIGWVARPAHDNASDGFKRAGRFKKASNMNYGLALSLKAEKHLEGLMAKKAATAATAGQRTSISTSHNSHVPSTPMQPQYGMQYQHREGDDQDAIAPAPAMPGTGSAVWAAPGGEDLEEKALGMAIEEVFEESGGRFRPWAANGRSTRLGEIVLIVDSDTIVPEDCLRDAAREMRECPTVAIIQHESDVMQVAHHYFENGIAYFTRRINRCISMACANGEVAPFMGHNAFLRWKAIQDAAFIDPADGKEKIWSESNVSEDFDMALRLMLKGYIIRWATYSKGAFKEGVSLSVDDELNRWQKYAYGCSELLFNPLVQWLRKGPINHQIHRFLWSSAPIHYKISMMAYGIAASVTIAVINYVLLGFHFETWLATTVVFFGSGNIGYTLLEYRLGQKQLLRGFLENVMWIPSCAFFFFGGLAIPVSQAILAHMFSYNISWSATVKEVQRSNFFKEIPKIAKRFWFPLGVSLVLIAVMIVLSTTLVPYQWRIDGSAWAIIFPLSVSAACHILFPIVLNPWLMVFSY